jgi:hypothetical protein
MVLASREFKLPGYESVFSLDKPILPKSNFYWREALWCGSAGRIIIPFSKGVVENILSLAGALQVARVKIGLPFIVTSWYRPEPWNANVGGVPNSSHTTGRGLDFWIPGLTVSEMASRLSWWEGGLGAYPSDGHIHLDIDNHRRW